MNLFEKLKLKKQSSEEGVKELGAGTGENMDDQLLTTLQNLPVKEQLKVLSYLQHVLNFTQESNAHPN